MSDLVPLLTYASVYEAHNYRNLLADEGIEAVVDGEVSASMLSHIGRAVDTRLMVQRVDAERAARILADAKQESDQRTKSEWFCGKCQEIVDGGFEVCWSCGGRQHEVEDPTVDPTNLKTTDSAAVDATLADDTRSRSVEAFPNPGQTDPQGVRTVDDEPPVQTATFSDATQLQLRRAWRASLFGVGFFPLMVYSVYLLVTLPVESDWPAEESRRFCFAWLLNGFIFAEYAVILKLGVGGGF